MPTGGISVKSIDLNVDIGEGSPYDAELLLFASSANICCGAHAGSWSLTQETIGMAMDSGCRIGMHPGYPDREHMGRRQVEDHCAKAYFESIRTQIEQFFYFVPAAYIKPHGAFYHDVLERRLGAETLLYEQLATFKVAAMGQEHSGFDDVPTELIIEGFVDRRYGKNNRLVPRTQPNATLVTEREIRTQAVELARRCDSLCLHGDTPNCLLIARWVTEALLEHGYRVEAPAGPE